MINGIFFGAELHIGTLQVSNIQDSNQVENDMFLRYILNPLSYLS
jgi:hypothetical protein